MRGRDLRESPRKRVGADGAGASVARVLVASIALAMTSAGCLDEIEPLNAEVGEPVAARCIGADSDPDISVGFRADVLPILMRNEPGRAGCSCHQPTAMVRIGIDVGGLDLSSYAGLSAGGVNSRGTVFIPGDPCNSIIIQKTGQGPPFGSRMPFNGPPFLTDVERQTLIDWIAEGANDN